MTKDKIDSIWAIENPFDPNITLSEKKRNGGKQHHDTQQMIEWLEGEIFEDVSYNKTRKRAWNEAIDMMINKLRENG